MTVVLIILGLVFIGIPWALGSVTLILIFENAFKGEYNDENSRNKRT